MPSTYAHQLFGRQCTGVLSPELQLLIAAHQPLFDIAVHGPDVFLFYQPYRTNDVLRLALKMHASSGRELFARFRSLWQEQQGGPDRDAVLVYLLGFLCHFDLDACCHGYVERKREAAGITHHRVESQYDAMLLRRDGLIPSRADRAACLSPSPENVRILSLCSGLDAETTLGAIRWHIRCLRWMRSRLGIRRAFGRMLLRMAGKADLGDMFLTDDIDSRCEDSNLRLEKLQARALNLYPALTATLLDYLNNGTPLPRFFDRTLKAGPGYRSLPVLSPEEEERYVLPDDLSPDGDPAKG